MNRHQLSANDRSYQAALRHNRNTLWCGALVQELVNHGIRIAVLGIGGRSAAMAMVLDARPEIETLIFNDERAGAFYALGQARVSGEPVAVCTTSGSAVANLAPALTEAKACGIPLVLLTCDRPRSIRKAGAPQCADQMGILRALVEAGIDLPDPDDSVDAIATLQKDVQELLRRLDDPATRGPLHLNIPQHGQLASTDPEPNWIFPEISIDLFQERRHVPDVAIRTRDAQIGSLDGLGLRPGMKGLIFVGPDAPINSDQINTLARKTQFPVLADAPSGLRRPWLIPTLVWNGDLLLLTPPIVRERPEVIIRIGEVPVSYMAQRYLRGQSCRMILLSRHAREDFLCPESTRLTTKSEIAALADLLAPGDPAWSEFWLSEAQRVQLLKDEFVSSLAWGECRAASMICSAEGYDLFHAANSMSIRHANLYCDARESPQTILVNRGVSGTDGTISSFFGAIHGSSRRGLLLVGDQAAAHDLGSLQLAKRVRPRGALCIMNNGGSAIFDLLSCAKVPDYERVIRNDPDVDFEHIAAAFRIPYERCTHEMELANALRDSTIRDTLSILEVCVPPDSLTRDLPRLFSSLMLNG